MVSNQCSHRPSMNRSKKGNIPTLPVTVEVLYTSHITGRVAQDIYCIIENVVGILSLIVITLHFNCGVAREMVSVCHHLL